jgi:hypothetical protein
VEHERQALGRREGVEHHEQGEAHGVLHQHAVLGVGRRLGVDDRVGEAGVEPVLAPGRPGPQQVEAHTGDDRGEPAADVVDAVGAGAVGPQPRLLQGVVGLVERAEHPVGDGPQLAPLGGEPFRQPVPILVHPCHIPRSGRVITLTNPNPPM